MGQVVQGLPTKDEVVSSNSSPYKRKKETKKVAYLHLSVNYKRYR
jgi:hypothetical protein